jgi:hypothetical protein
VVVKDVPVEDAPLPLDAEEDVLDELEVLVVEVAAPPLV